MRFADRDSMHNTGYWVKYTNIRSLGFVWFSTHRRDLIPWSRFVLVVRGWKIYRISCGGHSVWLYQFWPDHYLMERLLSSFTYHWIRSVWLLIPKRYYDGGSESIYFSCCWLLFCLHWFGISFLLQPNPESNANDNKYLIKYLSAIDAILHFSWWKNGCFLRLYCFIVSDLLDGW